MKTGGFQLPSYSAISRTVMNVNPPQNEPSLVRESMNGMSHPTETYFVVRHSHVLPFLALMGGSFACVWAAYRHSQRLGKTSK